MARELPKTYDPKQVEHRIYSFWQDNGFFKTKRDPDKKPFTIVMPPPNVTGQLHMGHAMDEALQDILIRRNRHADQGGGGAPQGGSDPLRPGA